NRHHEARLLPSSAQERAAGLQFRPVYLWPLRFRRARRSALCGVFRRCEATDRHAISRLSLRDQTSKTLCPGAEEEQGLAGEISTSSGLGDSGVRRIERAANATLFDDCLRRPRSSTTGDDYHAGGACQASSRNQTTISAALHH